MNSPEEWLNYDGVFKVIEKSQLSKDCQLEFDKIMQVVRKKKAKLNADLEARWQEIFGCSAGDCPETSVAWYNLLMAGTTVMVQQHAVTVKGRDLPAIEFMIKPISTLISKT